MPPVPLDPSAALLVHTLVPVTPTQLAAIQAEDYLLIRRVVISGTRQTKRKINSEGKCYSRIDYDPRLIFAVDALALSPFGLANWHPGANMTTSMLAALPVLPFNNGLPHFGFDLTLLQSRNIYENPVLTEEPGTFPSIAFNVVREFSDVVSTPLPLPAPATVTTVSWPDIPAPEGSDYEAMFGKSLMWFRTVSLTGPGGHVLVTNFKHWQTRPAGETAPADYTAFRATVDTLPEVTGENVITECFDLTVLDGQYLLDSAGHVIRGALEYGTNPAIPPSWNFWIQWESAIDGTFAGSEPFPQTDPPLTTAAEVLAVYSHPPEDGLTATAIYALDQAAWLVLPP